MNVIADAFNLSFSGRSPRRNYWIAILFYALGGYLLQTLDYALWDITITEVAWNTTQYVIAACYLVIFVLAWAMTVRRFHDIGRTGWWSLVCLLPLLGNILSIIIGLLASAEGANRYGPEPLRGRSAADACAGHNSGFGRFESTQGKRRYYVRRVRSTEA